MCVRHCCLYISHVHIDECVKTITHNRCLISFYPHTTIPRISSRSHSIALTTIFATSVIFISVFFHALSPSYMKLKVDSTVFHKIKTMQRRVSYKCACKLHIITMNGFIELLSDANTWDTSKVFSFFASHNCCWDRFLYSCFSNGFH